MEVNAISNTEASSLHHVLTGCLDPTQLTTVRVAVSFLMQSGALALRPILKKLTDSGVPVRFIFGDDFHLTESAAIKILMDLGCDLRLFIGENNYHPKLWIIDKKQARRTVVVGSSNLSRGGLIANVEANVLIAGTTSELDAFGAAWDELYSRTRQFTAKDLESYIDAEKAMATPAPGTWKSASRAVEAIRQHIERWQRFIADSQKIGQNEKWRGWYLVPEHGQLTDTKLVELRKLLQAIQSRPEYRRHGSISLGTDSVDVANIAAILNAAGIRATGSQTDAARRNTFIRQQRLYLVNLGWLQKESGDVFRITTAGKDFANSRTAPERKRRFTEAMSRIKWPFGPIQYYEFLRRVMKRVPQQRIYYDELNLIVIHSYHWAEIDGIANLVTAYRNLPAVERKALHDWADERLKSRLSRHGGTSAYQRYMTKVSDLLVAFGNTDGIGYKPAGADHSAFIYLSS